MTTTQVTTKWLTELICMVLNFKNTNIISYVQTKNYVYFRFVKIITQLIKG